jgi:hypothetical protein
MGKCGLNGGKLGALVGLKGNIDYRVCNGHKKNTRKCVWCGIKGNDTV